jgi:hypothetical protein
MSLFQEYANRHGLCQVCEFKLADCICNRKMEPLRKRTEPPASEPPQKKQADDIVELIARMFDLDGNWDKERYVYRESEISAKIRAQKGKFVLAGRAASSHTELQGLPARWRECAHLCQTTGLKDERAMHRAIVYDECAAALEAALGDPAAKSKD